ncbi:MAG: SdpI family protein [Thermoanaerobaculia bacterium]|nr:SdpI family protein [Thermoanaerobaculia bacterium]
MGREHPIRLADFRWGFLLVAVSWALGLWLFTRAPEQVPVHWNAAGEVDRYGSRFEGTLVLPAVATGLVLLLAFLPRLDPREENYGRFRTPYIALTYLILGFLLLVQIFTAAEIAGRADLLPFELTRLLTAALGLLFVGIGILLPRLEPNWFAGIRTPWTLEDDRVWMENHAFAGRVFVGLGVLTVLLALALPVSWGFWIVVASVLGATVVVVLHGYLVYRRLHDS